MLRIFRPEIHVSQKVIIQEPGSQLHSQGEHAERQRPDLVCCQGIPGLGKKASGKGREQLHAAASLFVLPGVLRHIIGAEPDGVAEIMAHKTGHHRIQIDDGQSPVGVPVEKDIVDLRIVVGHPDGETAFPLHPGHFTGLAADGPDIRKLLPHRPGQAQRIFFCVLKQRPQPFRRVVEIGDRFIKLFCIKIRQIFLETAKGFSGMLEHFCVFACVIRHRRDIIIQPPEAVVCENIRFPVGSMVKVERDPLGAFCPDMLRNQVDIVHDLLGLSEYKCVDLLDNVRL